MCLISIFKLALGFQLVLPVQNLYSLQNQEEFTVKISPSAEGKSRKKNKENAVETEQKCYLVAETLSYRLMYFESQVVTLYTYWTINHHTSDEWYLL